MANDLGAGGRRPDHAAGETDAPAEIVLSSP
jgi:hypothetical protein